MTVSIECLYTCMFSPRKASLLHPHMPEKVLQLWGPRLIQQLKRNLKDEKTATGRGYMTLFNSEWQCCGCSPSQTVFSPLHSICQKPGLPERGGIAGFGVLAHRTDRDVSGLSEITWHSEIHQLGEYLLSWFLQVPCKRERSSDRGRGRQAEVRERERRERLRRSPGTTKNVLVLHVSLRMSSAF